MKIYYDEIDYPITIKEYVEMYLDEAEEDDYYTWVDSAYDDWD